MSLTVIAIASLHAALPWIAGQQTKKMRWVVVATCIAFYAAIIVGNGAYVITDLLATGVGFFIGRTYVVPRSERKKLRSQASICTDIPENRVVARPTQTISHSSSEEPAALIDVVAVYRVVCPHCGTMFRVVSDQLELRGGIVRCGACEEIFDGRATLQ